MSVLDTRPFDPVFDAQRVFRCLLQATASPGKIFTLLPTGVDAPEAVTLTLLDHEVSFSAVGESAEELEERISRMTGARVGPAREADFVLISGEDSGDMVLNLKRGALERPETGATVIYAVERLDSGPLTLRLSGPGVPDKRVLAVEGLSESGAEALRESRSDYPLGVDVYLVDEAGRVAGLPRSTRLEVNA